MARRFLIAMQFLTVIPVDPGKEISPEDIGRSLPYFPVVGLFIGIILGLVAYAAGILPGLVRGAIVLAASMAITGGIHLDGLADTCDGLYGRRPREDVLRIMRDSRIGTMGALGLFAALVFKFAVFSSMPAAQLCKVLVFTCVFSRWAQVFACGASEYARNEGKARSFIEHARKSDVVAGAFATAALGCALFGMIGAAIFAASFASIFLFVKYVKYRIGGMTGDTIGASSEIAETASLFFSVIFTGCVI